MSNGIFTQKKIIWDYLVLSFRFLLGFVLIDYGYSKLTNDQFGLTKSEYLETIKNLNLFRLSWYLFDHQPFKSFIGISQILCGILLIINRTAIVGAIMFLPIAINILVIDLTIMPKPLNYIFAWRFTYYLCLDFLVFYHYKEKIIIIWQNMTSNIKPKFNHSFGRYLALPIMAIFLELAGSIPNGVINILYSIYSHSFWTYLVKLKAQIIEFIGF